jgi:hypothetical protein
MYADGFPRKYRSFPFECLIAGEVLESEKT